MPSSTANRQAVRSSLRIGTAGWSIPKLVRDDFFPAGVKKPNHLLAYSSKLNAVEINSSFYKDHTPKTYERWAETTPDDFRFSIKLAKRYTHEQKLAVDHGSLTETLEGVLRLGVKLGALLVQLPPKLDFESAPAEEFFATVREFYEGPIAFEPRHRTWIQRDATRILEDFKITRVIADPSPTQDPDGHLRKAAPVRGTNFAYYRLHGSPKVYYSDYEPEQLHIWSENVRESVTDVGETWCIFDNTALGFATQNALTLTRELN